MPVDLTATPFQRPGFRPQIPVSSKPPAAVGRVDNVIVTAFPFRTEKIRLENFLVSISWNDDAERAAIEVTMVFDNSEDIARQVLAPGTWLEVKIFDPFTGRYIYPLPRLHVFERAITDANEGTATIVALDVLAFLMRQGEATYFFRQNKAHKKGWTAAQIAKRVLSDLDIDALVIPTAYRIPYLMLQNVTPYDVLVKAFATDRIFTGTKYRIRAGQFDKRRGGLVRLDWVVIDPIRLSDYTWELSEGSNLTNAEWRESLDGVRTEFIGVSMNKAGSKEARRIRVISKNAPRYGRIREIQLMDPDMSPKKMQTKARATLAKLGAMQREASVTSDGVPILRSCDSVVVKEKGTRLSGVFFIKGVQQDIAAGQHTMSVDLSYTQTFPLPDLTTDEIGLDQGGTGVPGVGYIGEKVVAFARSQIGDAYVWGGNGPNQWDCSGLTKAAWASVGITLPRTVAGQMNAGISVGSIDQAAAGDLLTRGSTHVGLYSGNQTVVHAPNTGDVVKEVPIGGFTYDQIRRPGGDSNAPVGTGEAGAVTGDQVSFLPPSEEYLFVAEEFANATGGGAGSGVSGSYPGDASSKKAVAQWMAAKAEAAGIPGILPVMAALAESGIDNTKIGDQGAALGYFQIHASRAISDGGTANSRKDPEWQVQWFIKNAQKEKSHFESYGESGYHKWIQAIEDSGTPSGSQYAAQLDAAKKLVDG